MYIIIDTTTGKVWKHEGNNPIDIIDRIVNKGCTPIVENDTTEDIDRDELLYYRNVYIFEEY